MPTVEGLQRKLLLADKRIKFAWSRYYITVREELGEAHQQWRVMERTMTDEDVSIPTHIKNDILEMASKLRRKWECPICQDMIEVDSIEITNCGHFYCKGCLEELKARTAENGKWKCCVCRRQYKK